jgi:PAS domain S-box-containing protein
LTPDAVEQLIAENGRLRAEVARLRAAVHGPGADGLAADLATAIQGLPILVFLFDADDRYVEYRAGRAADLYVSPEAFVGKRIDEVIPPPLGGTFRELMARARAEAKELLHEYHLDMPSGRQEFEARIVPLAAGRVAMLVTDVTERRRGEERLRDSEERFRLAFDAAPIGMALVGLDEQLLDVNASLCAILGYTRERLVRMTVPQITHPDDVGVEERNKRVLLGGGRSYYRMEKRYLHAEGHVVWGALSVTAVTGPDGNPRYFIGQLEDITERRDAEARLRASEERWRALSERATDVLAVFDATGRVALWSPGATEALGWEPAEIVGRAAVDFLHPDDADAGGAALARLLATPGAAAPMTVRIRHRNGSWRVLEGIYRNLVDVPAVAGIVVNARDVTDQRRLEEQFQHSQKLESIGRLAGGVAHDFNNILTVILSCAEQLEADEAAGRANPEDVREIRSAAERARDLTRQLLAFARRQVIAPVVLDANALLRDSQRLLARVLGEDVALHVELAPDLWRIRCDPAQLQQVILNLAVNARDAMPRGGKLTLETANVVLDEAYASERAGVAPGPHVLVAVSDSGEGMTDEARAHVFEPFFTTKPAGHGTGLGLATVYGVVRQSGGHVWVYSERGRGTTFKLYFPRTDGSPAEPVAPPPPTARPAGDETILVVEDDALVREVTARALRGGGYRVLEASSGAAALEAAATATASIRLVVTDVVMPDMSGREVAEALQDRIPGVRVLYVSGYTQNTIVHHGVLDSGIEFLSKPFTPSALLARVREVLERR